MHRGNNVSAFPLRGVKVRALPSDRQAAGVHDLEGHAAAEEAGLSLILPVV